MVAASRRRPIRDADERVAFHQRTENDGTIRTGRHEQAQLPRDDLRDQAGRLQPIDHAVGEAGQLDPEFAHDLGAAKLETLLEIQNRPAVEHSGPGVGCRDRRRFGVGGLRHPGR